MAKNDNRILNCKASKDTEQDWEHPGPLVIEEQQEPPPNYDLRRDWWYVRNQLKTGSCVGFAIADGIIRYYKKQGEENKDKLPSPRYIYMGAKEYDAHDTRPTSFHDSAFTSIKSGLKIALKFGCVEEKYSPFHNKIPSYTKREASDLSYLAGQLKITSFFNFHIKGVNIKRESKVLKKWISLNNPILIAIDIDNNFKKLNASNPFLDKYNISKGQHAVCLVGYTSEGNFILRNSWGTNWGENGFAYVTPSYLENALKETYGVIILK